MFVILHGDDVVRAGREYHRRRDEADPSGLNTTLLDDPRTTVSDVIAAADVMPFFGGQRCVAVRGLLLRLTRPSERAKGATASREAQLAELIDYAGRLPATTTLLCWDVVGLKLPPALIKAVQANGAILAFEAPARLGDLQGWLETWIGDEARSQAIALTREATQRLAASAMANIRAADSAERQQQTGIELVRLTNELVKLSTYVGVGGSIDGRTVALLALDSRAQTFELVDAVAARATPRALQLLDQTLREGHEPLALLHQIGRHISNLLRAATAGGREAQIIAALGVPDWLARKYAQQVRGFGLPQLRQAHARLLAADVSVKTGRASAEAAIRDAVLALCLSTSPTSASQ